MTNRIAALALAAAFALPAAGFAAGTVEMNAANEAQVRAVLTEQGYEVARVKVEDGKYEAYAKKDGNRMEVFLDGDFAIVEIKD